MSKIKVYLTPEDMKGRFEKLQSCPLARALKRKFKTNDVSVTNSFTDVYTKNKIISYKFDDDNDWNEKIAKNVRLCYKQGDTTKYYVQLIKI